MTIRQRGVHLHPPYPLKSATVLLEPNLVYLNCFLLLFQMVIKDGFPDVTYLWRTQTLQ